MISSGKIKLTLRRLALPVLLTAVGCVVQVVDVRYDQPGNVAVVCGADERLDPLSGACSPCDRLPPAPGACLCAWAYREAPFPYCADPQAFYVCLPCADSIASCNDFTRPASAGEPGTTHDCARMAACCGELAGAQPSVHCCACGATLTCAPDPTDPEHLRFVLGCDPEPTCHGTPCPLGNECQSFQTCVAGECTPACNPLTETCSVESGCICEVVPP